LASRSRKQTRPTDQANLADVIGYRLRLAQLAVFRDFLDTFASMRIKPVHYSMLRLIEANPGLKQGELARALGIKRANMVTLVDTLEKRGLAARKSVQGDRRSYALHLTEQGQAFTRKMQEVWTGHEARFVKLLGGPRAKQQLIELLDRIVPLG